MTNSNKTINEFNQMQYTSPRVFMQLILEHSMQ